MASERITLGGGCFRCVEAVFERVDGMLTVASGCNGPVEPFRPTCRKRLRTH